MSCTPDRPSSPPPDRPADNRPPNYPQRTTALFRVLGQITRRLLDQIPADDPAWTPPRSAMRPVTRPAAEGRSVGAGPDRRKAEMHGFEWGYRPRYVRISRAGWAPRSRWRAVWDFATTLPFIVGPSCALWLAIVVYQGRELVYIP